MNPKIEKSKIIHIKSLQKQGITKYELYRFIEQNQYEKVDHGIYVLPNIWIDERVILSIKYPQAVFSHDEALYFHGLIDREPNCHTITIYSGYGVSKLNQSGVKVFTVSKKLLEVGREYIKTDTEMQIPIYNLERTICDLIRSRKKFEIQDFKTALKTYIQRNDKDLNRLMEYAKLFHVDQLVRGYLEVML